MAVDMNFDEHGDECLIKFQEWLAVVVCINHTSFGTSFRISFKVV